MKCSKQVFISSVALLLIGSASMLYGQTVANPLARSAGEGVAADPYIAYVNGSYYLLYTGTLNAGIRKAASLADLANAAPVAAVDSSYNCTQGKIYWRADRQKWYLYDNCGANTGLVFESDDGDANNGQTHYHQVNSDICESCWDTNLMEYNGALYLLYSGNGGDIQIAPLSDPFTRAVDTNNVVIPARAIVHRSEDPNNWETINDGQFPCCIEGPSVIEHGGKLSLSYSGNFWNSSRYATGVAVYDGVNDITADTSWTKLSIDGPAFGGNQSAVSIYGAGAVTFFPSPDNSQTWMVYHAWPFNPDYGAGDSRVLYVQQIYWNGDNTPNLGTPVGANAQSLPSGDPGPA